MKNNYKMESNFIAIMVFLISLYISREIWSFKYGYLILLGIGVIEDLYKLNKLKQLYLYFVFGILIESFFRFVILPVLDTESLPYD